MTFSSLTAVSRRLALGASTLLAAGALAVPAAAPASPIPPDLCPACAQNAPLLPGVVAPLPANIGLGYLAKPMPMVDPGHIKPVTNIPADTAPPAQGNQAPAGQGNAGPAQQGNAGNRDDNERGGKRDDNERGGKRGGKRDDNERGDDRGGDDFGGDN